MTDVFFRGYGKWKAVIGKDTYVMDLEPDVVEDISGNLYASGVFKLTDKDETIFRHIKNIENIGVEKLLPSKHPDSEFSNGLRYNFIKLNNINADCPNNVFFLLNKDQPSPITLILATQYEPPKIEKYSETIAETERATILKLILGMAIDAYKYNPDPECKKNSATGSNQGSIKFGLEKHGLSADEKTISKYLKEAAERYPDARPRKQ